MRTSNLKPHRLSSTALFVALAVAIGVTAMPLDGYCDDAKAQKAGEKPKPVAKVEPVDAAASVKTAKLRENSYYYGAFNRRDPFRSLVEGAFVRDDMMELVDLNAVELVGVVKGELERFGLLEDDKGFTYILRVGDKVRNGTIVAIGEQTLTARIVTFGQASKFTLHMVERQKGDKR